MTELERERERTLFTLDAATYPSKVASTGVLQGEAANAKVSPAKYACTPNNAVLFIIKTFKQPDYI